MSPRKPHYLVIWEFHVKPERRLAFEEAYGEDVGWAQLFRRSSEYLGTQLLRDIDQSGRYLTFDRWTSSEAFHQFKHAHQSDYDAFDKQCESLTDHETLIGEFAA